MPSREALDRFDKVLKILPQLLPGLHYARAMALHGLGKWEEAKAALQMELAVHSSHIPAKKFLATLQNTVSLSQRPPSISVLREDIAPVNTIDKDTQELLDLNHYWCRMSTANHAGKPKSKITMVNKIFTEHIPAIWELKLIKISIINWWLLNYYAALNKYFIARYLRDQSGWTAVLEHAMRKIQKKLCQVI